MAVEAMRDVVADVAIYPIKSCAAATIEGEKPDWISVGATGFEEFGVRDRDYVLVDAATGDKVTQRGWDSDNRKVVHPNDRELARVQVDLQPGWMTVSSSIGDMDISTKRPDRNPRVVDIFGKQLVAVEQGAEASEYFSTLLGRAVLLLRSSRQTPRILPEHYQRDGAQNMVAAADGMPFLLASRASLAMMNNRNDFETEVPIDRYRPNIVIEGKGLGAFGEDWIDPHAEMQIGRVGMWVVKACSRCPIPTIDQESGERDGTGLKVLHGRSGEIDKGNGDIERGVFFGQNLVHRYDPTDSPFINIGDPVLVESVANVSNVKLRDTSFEGSPMRSA